MTFSPLENEMLLSVAQKPQSVTDLYKKYVTGKRCSRAGFYKALEGLRNKEVVVEKEKVLSMNKIWLADSFYFFKKLVRQKTQPSYFAEQIIQIKSGDRLVYTFKSIAEIDIFLLNLIYDLLLLKVDKQVFIVEPHEFFVLLNSKRTSQILQEIRQIGCSLFLLIESTSGVDKAIVKNQLATPAKGYVSEKKISDVAKITHVLGDICIELRLDKSFAKGIDYLFSKQELGPEDLANDLKQIIGNKQKHQIVIYKDKNKVRKIKVRFKKYFFGVKL